MNSERPNGIDTPDDDSEYRALVAPFADILGSEATWAEPPAGLVDSIVDRIRSTSPDGGALAPPVSIASRRRPVWAVPAMAAAAAATAFLAGFLIADRNDDDDVSAIADIELAGTALAPDARARGDVLDRGAGYAIRLDMAGLPPAAEGEFYEGWLRAEDGEMVSVGTFHMRSGDGDVVLWSGVRIAEYDTLIVTEEQERSGAEASDRVVLEGAVERRG